MEFSVVVSSFALLFIAEMGDKTQLMTMTLAQRYRPLPVAGGVCAAFLVLNLLAVLLGGALFRIVPQRGVLLAAGLLFLVFAWKSWREASRNEDDADAPAARTDARGAFLASFGLIFMAELGDKTQLALITLVAASGSPWSVFVGGTLALWAVSLIGVMVGGVVLSRLPRAWIQRAAAVLFMLFGVLAIARVLGSGRGAL